MRVRDAPRSNAEWLRWFVNQLRLWIVTYHGGDPTLSPVKHHRRD